MSGFFSLGGGGKDPQDNLGTSNNNNNNLLLFKNDEIYNKGFELWQQYYQLHQQRSVSAATAAEMVDFGVEEMKGGGGDREQGPNFRVMRQQVGGGVNCQDCGNQAKKDCAHLRCRTCCRSRGFPCQTHVKSTWVPAAKRRERQQQSQQQLGLMRSSSSPDRHHHHLQIKRHRDDSSSSSPLPITRIPTISSSASDFPGGHFPSELNSPAVFRCVKVSAMDDEIDQYAYQTAVSIGGHVFKGILYDQGPEARSSGGGENSSAGHQQAASAALLDPSVYPTPLNAFMAGTQSFPPPRS